MRRRSTWRPDPVSPTPGQVLPILTLLALLTGTVALLFPYLVWGGLVG